MASVRNLISEIQEENYKLKINRDAIVNIMIVLIFKISRNALSHLSRFSQASPGDLGMPETSVTLPQIA